MLYRPRSKRSWYRTLFWGHRQPLTLLQILCGMVAAGHCVASGLDLGPGQAHRVDLGAGGQRQGSVGVLQQHDGAPLRRVGLGLELGFSTVATAAVHIRRESLDLMSLSPSRRHREPRRRRVATCTHVTPSHDKTT